MSVLGRKMFKDPSNRGARNMLKGMGGIMSSSPELANAVQGYEEAGQVRTEPKSWLPEFLWKSKPSDSRLLGDVNVELKNSQGEPIGPNLYTDQTAKFGEFPIEFLYSIDDRGGVESATTRRKEFFDIPEGYENVPMYGPDGKFRGYTTMPIGGSGIEEIIPDFSKVVVDEESAAIRKKVYEDVMSEYTSLGGKVKNAYSYVRKLFGDNDERILALFPKGTDFAKLDSLSNAEIDDLFFGKGSVGTLGRPDWAIPGSGITQFVSKEPPLVMSEQGIGPAEASVFKYDDEGFKRRPSEELLMKISAKGFPVEDAEGERNIQEILRRIQEEPITSPDSDSRIMMDGTMRKENLERFKTSGDPDARLKELQKEEEAKQKVEQEARRREVESKRKTMEAISELGKDKDPALGTPGEAEGRFGSVSEGEGQTAEEIAQTGTAEEIAQTVTDNLPASVFGDTHQEKSSSLEDIMTSFKSKAPKFKGMDKGMAIAKIGFAMAAGQSPML